MNLVVEKARVGALGVDTDTPLTAASAPALRAAGVEFVVRYVRDVTRQELDAIFDAGLAFMGVGHVRRAGWFASAGIGQLDGMTIVDAAKRLALPATLTLWCDLEGLADGTGSQDAIAYVNAWAAAVSSGSFEPGLYVGDREILTARELFYALRVRRYWRSGSAVPTPEERGYCLVQRAPFDATIAGVKVDHDVVQADGFGDVPTWVRAATDTSLPPAA